jgi:hypothetical protein
MFKEFLQLLSKKAYRKGLRSALLPLVFLLLSVPVPAQQPLKPATSQAQSASSAINKDSVNRHPSSGVLPGIRKSIDRYPLYFLFIFGGSFVLLALIRLLAPSELRDMAASVLNLKLLLNLFKDGRFGFSLTNLLMDLIAILMFSVFIQQFFFPLRQELFPWILAYVCLGYLLKMIAIQLMAHIFMGRGEALLHLLLHMLFSRATGLVLLPLLFILLYQTFIPIGPALFTVAWALLGFYLLWTVRLYAKMKSMSTSGAFYLFLYLCTIELSPLLILLKGFILK